MTKHDAQNFDSFNKRIVGKNFKLLFITGFWVLIMLLAVSSQLVHTETCRTILDVIQLFELPNYGTWAALSPLILLFGGRFPLEKNLWKSRVPLTIAFGLLISFVQAIPQEVVNVTIDTSPTHAKTISHSITNHIIPQMPLKFLIFCSVLGMGYAFDFYRQFQERDARLSQTEKRLVQAKLEALKSQLQPHFLFNTLNAVSALVEKDPAASRRMIARLSELLRLTLDSQEQHEITLESELALLKHYLEIEQIRFEDRLQVNYNIATETHRALVPNMILQPLVENAIKHGVQKQRSGGVINISAHHENERLHLVVEDDGPGVDFDAETFQRGVGLKNTQSRLRQLYGEDHSFSLENAGETGLKVRISLPYRKT